VTIPKPEHFFEQAEKLISTPVGGGALRQVDIRRAISAAYYGLFHATMAAAADLVVGANKRSGNHYALAYRKTDHGVLKGLCADITNKSLPPKLARLAPSGGFDSNIRAFATAVVALQLKRYSADYDPTFRPTKTDAKLDVLMARTALTAFQKADAASREAFIFLLLFPPR
jgi:hypothetical protein